MGKQHLLRQTLQRFFQERRIKVSLFLLVRLKRLKRVCVSVLIVSMCHCLLT